MRFLFTIVANSEDLTGGIESSLKNLTRELLEHGHIVDVLEFNKKASFKPLLDDRIHFLEMDKKSKYCFLDSEDFQTAHGFRKILLSGFGVFKKILRRFNLWYDFVFKDLRLPQKYDAAVAFRQSDLLNYVITKKVGAEVKIAFIHSEIDGSNTSWTNYYQDIDYIACVSDACGKGFAERFPEYKEKVRTIYNIFESKNIIEKSKESILFDDTYFNIITVARIETPQKKIETIPAIFDKIKNFSGKKIRWYIVGDGRDRNLVEDAIRQYHCEDQVILLGSQKNPYPYIKNADLFVLTSSWETYGMVVVESLILGTPVIAGDYPALHEILSDNVNGIIAENSVDGISAAIISLLKDREKYNKLKENCMNFHYTSETTYHQLTSLIKRGGVKMNLCILTMTRVDNYGSVLQAYALKTTLERLGHTVSFIDIENDPDEYERYRNSYQHIYEQNYRVTGIRRYLTIDRYFFNRIDHRIQEMHDTSHKMFEQFRSDVLKCGALNSNNEGHYDFCIIGSDEMFNCLSERLGYVSQMFGNVVQAERVMSYAASCGFASYEATPDKMRLELSEQLQKMKAISVRDQNSASFVNSLIGKEPIVNLDPVLIYDFSKEKQNAEKLKLPPKYCLVYAYGNRINDDNEIREIWKFCKRENMTLISAGGEQDWIFYHVTPSPFQMLNVVENASFVITDTFHGTIFSYKYAEKFAVILRDSNRNKLGDLVKRLCIENHTVCDMNDIGKIYEINNNREKNREYLASENLKSVQYLEAALNE